MWGSQRTPLDLHVDSLLAVADLWPVLLKQQRVTYVTVGFGNKDLPSGFYLFGGTSQTIYDKVVY